MSLFHASTFFEHMCSSSGGQKLYYTVSGIITPVGGRPVHRLREESSLHLILKETVHISVMWRGAHRECVVRVQTDRRTDSSTCTN